MNIGIWLGFPNYTPMKREGISRYVLYLVKHLVKNFKVQIEIWTCEINKNECDYLFEDLLTDSEYSKYISILTEKNYLEKYYKNKGRIFLYSFKMNSTINMPSWKLPYRNYLHYCKISCSKKINILDYFAAAILLIKGIIDKILFKLMPINTIDGLNGSEDEILVKSANFVSNVDCFIIPVFLLVNGLKLEKKKIISLHDLHVYEFLDLFVEEWGEGNTKNWQYAFDSSITTISNHILNEKIYFISNCDYVRKNHTLKYIQSVKEELTDFVYLPVIIPDNIKKRIIKENILRDKFKIVNDYIFFPTQVRPYKNLITLVKALKVVIDQGFSIYVVLTGKLENSKIASKYVKENNLKRYIIETGDVSEEELYSLHKYAAATVVTSLFEGGLPWPALEGLFMDTPVIVPKIPVVIERLQSVGFNLHNCGLRLFEPLDYNELANEIIYSLRNRESIVTKQKPIKEVLLSYTWDDVAKKYYEIIQNKVLKS